MRVMQGLEACECERHESDARVSGIEMMGG